MTHYFTALALAGQMVYAAIRFRGPTLWAWIGAWLLAVALAMIAWSGAFLDQQGIITRQPWLVDAGEGHALRSLMRMTDLPLRLLFQLAPVSASPWRSVAGTLLLSVCAVALLRRPSREKLLMAVWFAVPCVALVVTDFTLDKQTLNHVRYPAMAVIGLAGLLALSIGELRPPARLVTSIALCVGVFVSLSFPTTSNPDARVAVAQLRKQLQPDDLVVFDAVGWPEWVPHFFAPIEYYMPNLARNAKLLLNEPPPAETVAAVAGFRRIMVVSPRLDAVPNPSPRTHTLAARSDYIWQIGWIYLFVRADDGERSSG